MTILIILMRFSPYHQPFIELTKILNERESIFVSVLKFKNSKNGSFPSDPSLDVCDMFYMEWNEKWKMFAILKWIGISYRPKIKEIIGKMNALLIKEQSNY